jgi:uncharacterized repeat protein (TIGR01451 family)
MANDTLERDQDEEKEDAPAPSQQQRPTRNRMQKPQRSRGKVAAGAAKGAAKEAGKQAAVEGAKGAARGAARGARAGAAAGSAIPVVGTAIGGVLGGLVGGVAGGTAGAAKGGLKGAGQGARQGAQRARQKSAAKEQSTFEKTEERGMKLASKALSKSGPEGQVAARAIEFLRKHKTIRRIAQAQAILPYLLPILLFAFILIIVMGDGAGAGESNLKITKSGPTEAVAGAELTYQITVSYPGQAKEIVVTDRIPDGTDYIESTPPAKYDPGTKTATWNLSEYQTPPGAILNNMSTTIVLKLRATADNAFLVNRAEATVTAYTPPASEAPPTEGYVPPQPISNTCSNKYNFSKWPDQNPLGNYGDPQCNFTKDNLYTLLQAKETNPEFVNIWFNMVVPVESGYSPNAFASPDDSVQCSLDCAGAWGLYQMGSSKPPGQAPPAPGKNGEYDRGDVNWETQTTMAINYNRILLKCNFRYWASAYNVWGKYSC